jgi:hypothetical protein
MWNWYFGPWSFNSLNHSQIWFELLECLLNNIFLKKRVFLSILTRESFVELIWKKKSKLFEYVFGYFLGKTLGVKIGYNSCPLFTMLTVQNLIEMIFHRLYVVNL